MECAGKAQRRRRLAWEDRYDNIVMLQVEQTEARSSSAWGRGSTAAMTRCAPTIHRLKFSLATRREFAYKESVIFMGYSQNLLKSS